MGIESFLNQIAGINKRYEEITKTTGENFNIFDVLNIKSDESTHSNFIAMLLNPDGVHGRGNIFLKYFLEIIDPDQKDISDFSVENVTVQTEFSIGPIDKECEHGGRIDIAIFNNKDTIFIENKIYAPDQKRQLKRYKNSCPNAKIIYLTLDSREPDNESAKDMTGDEYIRVSYKTHILEWLEKCKKETVNYPLLRESVQQYITLVKSLTGQARSKQMSDEILSAITKDEESLAAYLSVNAFAKEAVFKYVLENKVISGLEAIAGNMAWSLKKYRMSIFFLYKDYRKLAGIYGRKSVGGNSTVQTILKEMPLLPYGHGICPPCAAKNCRYGNCL
jgi:hypothetical protein